MATPNCIKTEKSTQENAKNEILNPESMVKAQKPTATRSSQRVKAILLKSQEQKVHYKETSDVHTGSAFSKFKRRKLSNDKNSLQNSLRIKKVTEVEVTNIDGFEQQH